MNAQAWAKKLLGDVLVMLASGAAVVVVFTHIYWLVLNITDGPPWVGYLIFGLCWLCSLPGLVLPYVAVSWCKKRITGRFPSFVCGVTYPLCLILLTHLGELFGRDMAWDKLVESAGGWGILLGMTVIPGIALSILSLSVASKQVVASS